VAEAYRNLSAVGALPMAITDNLNFGNPEKPEIMGNRRSRRGMARRAAPDYPVVSGNVSLYNETEGRAILPTPAIGGVGIVEDVSRTARIAFPAADQAILLVGRTEGWLGQSIYLREIFGREDGAPPPVDLLAERRHGDFVRDLILDGLATACHDCADGASRWRRRDGDGGRHRRRAASSEGCRCPPSSATGPHHRHGTQHRPGGSVAGQRRRRDRRGSARRWQRFETGTVVSYLQSSRKPMRLVPAFMSGELQAIPDAMNGGDRELIKAVAARRPGRDLRSAGDGDHYAAEVVSNVPRTVQQHQMVYKAPGGTWAACSTRSPSRPAWIERIPK
jgi:stress-induced morphogen